MATSEVKTRRIREDDLRGQPGLSRAAAAAIVAAQPAGIDNHVYIAYISRYINYITCEVDDDQTIPSNRKSG